MLADYVIEQMKTAVKEKRPFYIHHNMLLPHEPIIPTPAEKASGESPSLGRMIAYMDQLSGRIVRAVDELGIAENTYVIFMGDNGTDARMPRQTAAGLVQGGKRDLSDAGTHIPLIIRRPGTIQGGSVANDLVDMADWFPTMLELAGLDVPSDLPLDGVSFAGRILRDQPSKREWVTGGVRGQISVFDGSWRLDSEKNSLIDSRNLPAELPLGEKPSEHQQEWNRLRQVLREVQQ